MHGMTERLQKTEIAVDGIGDVCGGITFCDGRMFCTGDVRWAGKYKIFERL